MLCTPMAIVWPCPVSVEMYVADGRGVAVPRQSCPACSDTDGVLVGVSPFGADTVGGLFHRLWICRARCSGCGVSHALIPSFLLIGRHDAVDVIGEALTEIGCGSSIGRMGRRFDVPLTTVRGWVRRSRQEHPRQPTVHPRRPRRSRREDQSLRPRIRARSDHRRSRSRQNRCRPGSRQRVGPDPTPHHLHPQPRIRNQRPLRQMKLAGIDGGSSPRSERHPDSTKQK